MAGALLLTSAAVSAQTVIGYSNVNANGKFERKSGVRFGSTEKQGMAFCLPASKAALLKGKKITSITTGFGSTQLENCTLFITNKLGATPLYEQALTEPKTKMVEFPLTTPVEITGETLYIGYTFEAGTSYKAMIYDQTNNLPAGYSWAYEDGNWIDVSQSGLGAPNLFIKLDGTADFTDLMMKPIKSAGEYFKAGTPATFTGQLYNFGTTTIQSFEITCQMGSGEAEVLTVTDANLAPGATYDLVLPEVSTEQSGNLQMKVSLVNVNGAADADITENVAQKDVYLYPSDMERKILVEVFTGQACGNCPAGHQVMASALAGIEGEFIEVCHHSGYSPDYFTMAEDMEYTWFYGESTYAPAAMFNRMPYETGLTSPVFISNIASNVKAAVNATLPTEPYVGVKLSNQFDKETRSGKLTVDLHTYKLPNDAEHVLNVWLVQDGLVGSQTGASSNYVHNHVFRGTISGGAFGYRVNLKEGEVFTHSFDYTIPDSIASSYYDVEKLPAAQRPMVMHEAVLENISLVAFVGGYSQTDIMGHRVYNAASIPVTLNYTGVEEAPVATRRVALQPCGGGNVAVAGEHAGIKVYSMTGAVVAEYAAGVSAFSLPAGLYVARLLQTDGTVVANKLVVK